MLGFPSWASRGGGVNCAVFPSPRTAVIPQYLIFQFSQHRCLKALILVLCYFGHYFLCRKIYSSCYPIHFFLVLETELVASIFFSQHWLGSCCPYHILMSVKHLIHSAVWKSLSSAVCQCYQSAVDSCSKELSCRISLTALAHPATSHVILSLERASSWQHLVLSARDSTERKQAAKHLPKVLNKETVTELNSKAMHG